MSNLLEQLYFGELSPFQNINELSDEEARWYSDEFYPMEDRLRTLMGKETDKQFQLYLELGMQATFTKVKRVLWKGSA
jgi:hypothetical protein